MDSTTTSTRPLHWAILGPGKIAHRFADGLRASTRGTLHAVGSTDPVRAAGFAERWHAPVTGDYDDILTAPDVDAVYIATVHTSHADLAVRALEAGKAVLCEKPAATTNSDAQTVIDTARRTGSTFAEAYKFRFTPIYRLLLDAVRAGEFGEDLHVDTRFGFEAPDRTGRLFDPALGGGAILDVGGYPISMTVALAAAAGIDLDTLILADAHLVELAEGVDESASAVITAPGLHATVNASIVETLSRSLRVEGTRDVIHVDDVWGGRPGQPATYTRGVARATPASVDTVNAFTAEADAFGEAVRRHDQELTQATWHETLTSARLEDAWRAAGSTRTITP